MRELKHILLLFMVLLVLMIALECVQLRVLDQIELHTSTLVFCLPDCRGTPR